MAAPEEQAPAEDELSSTERVYLDIARARGAFGRDFGRHDPKGRFYLRRAMLNAILEIGDAVRREGGEEPAAAD